MRVSTPSHAVRCTNALLLAGLVLGTAAPAQDFVVENYAIARPLTAAPGDPERGKAVMIDRDRGNCLGCHAVPLEAEFFGTTGPALAGVADRLTPPQLRLRLVDSKQINPLSMMPSYYRTAGLYRVQEKFVGRTVLTAQEIEDVIAFLSTLEREQ